MSFVTRLNLTNFRNYESACFNDAGEGLVVVFGSNGAGKTNVLEALSLLSPGRGLRGVNLGSLQNKSIDAASSPWSINVTLESPYGTAKIGTGLDSATEKRIVRINGATARNKNALTEYVSCVWLTPQMDRIFLDSAGARRRFLDRLVFTFDPGHSGRVSRYENALSQRSKLLREGKNDPKWLKSLEAQIAENGVAVAAARIAYTARLQKACYAVSGEEKKLFPQASLFISGSVEKWLSSSPALEVEEKFLEALKSNRSSDAITGGASIGPHRSDFEVSYGDIGMPASQCSTGEQKALLTGIIVAHSRLVKAEWANSPLLLLDEVATHLDESRRTILFEILQDMKCQIWLTGTDKNLFSSLKNRAGFYEINDGAPV